MSRAPGWIPGALICLVAVAGQGCIELDLGSSPFFCNNGNPPCPPGYLCVQSGGKRLCVMEGQSPPQQDGNVATADGKKPAVDTGPTQDLGPSFDAPQPDMSVVADYWPADPDQFIKPDLPPPPDKSVKKDVPKIGCQNNAECKKKDPQNPCCCPVTIIWVCAPLCLNPLCLPI